MDKSLVDELGAAADLACRDDEPLDSDGKILDRDRNRWELNPASADEVDEEDDIANIEDDLDDEDVDDEEEDNDLGDEIENDEDRDL